MKNTSLSQRSLILDCTRAVAIILMIIFHVSFDLMLFGYNKIDFQNDKIWYALPRLIVFLFLFCVGSGLYLEHHRIIKWKNFFQRFFKLSFFAIVITISTYYMFPLTWVYFGTLHCIAICSLLCLPMVKIPKYSYWVGIFILLSLFFFHSDFYLLQRIFEHKSMDFIPPYPWVAIPMLGISATHFNWHKIPIPINKFTLSLAWMGKHSLGIYLIHQPLLYSLIWFFSYMMGR